jgi:hypothetical protein
LRGVIVSQRAVLVLDLLTDCLQVERRAGPLVAGLQRLKRILHQFAQLVPLLGGFWATQILPFGDPVSFIGYMDFETAFYSSLRQKQAA